MIHEHEHELGYHEREHEAEQETAPGPEAGSRPAAAPETQEAQQPPLAAGASSHEEEAVSSEAAGADASALLSDDAGALWLAQPAKTPSTIRMLSNNAISFFMFIPPACVRNTDTTVRELNYVPNYIVIGSKKQEKFYHFL